MIAKILLAMDFADWLKINRQKSGLSLRNLVERIDSLCSDAYLSQIENRRYKGKKGKFMQPDIAIVEALAKALDRPIDEARLAAGYAPKNASSVPKPILNAYAKAGHLTPEDDALVANFIEMLERQRAEEKGK